MVQRIVVALGGNALQKDGDNGAESQKRVARETARQLAQIVQAGHELIIGHGNGPQVGDILLAQQKAANPTPLDTCVSMSQGEIGYWLQQGLGNELRSLGINKSIATVTTQVVVSADDPAFNDPSKPIGQFSPDESAARAANPGDNVTVKEDAGRGWRRVVPSPQPINIIEADFIKQAVDSGSIVIATGGGGIPVTQQNGQLTGIEAVIDKDFAAAKLAQLVEADTLLILTNIESVSINFRQPNEIGLGHVTAAELEDYIKQGQFAPGSMLPKAQAAIDFVRSGESLTTIITSLDKITEALAGQAGTRVTRS